MKQHKFLKEINGEKVFCLEYDKETLKDLCLEYQERYIRLHNIYNITLKKKKILMDERDRQEKLIARQIEQIKELEKRIKKYESDSNSK